MDIGLEIRLLREKRRMTSKELAERLGVSQSQMSRLESGQRRIDARLLERIANVLGVPPGYFYGQHEEVLPEEGEADLRRAVREVGRVIRRRRHEIHLTPEELADRLGKPRTYVKALEDGEIGYIPVDTLQKICKVLKIQPFDLLDSQQRVIGDLKRQVMRLKQAHSERTLGAIEADDRQRRGIPVYGSVAKGYPTEFTVDGVPIDEVDDFVFVPRFDDEKAFAVYCVGGDMVQAAWPSFREGDVLIFSPKAEVRNRDFAFVRVHGHKPFFRQVHYDPNARVRLQPLNHNFPPVVVYHNDVIASARLVAHVARL